MTRPRKISQSESKRGAQQARRAAAPDASFLAAPAEPHLLQTAERDLAALKSHVDFRKLPSEHPIRTLWSASSSVSRFKLQHLADDLLALHGVDGLAGLLKRLLGDAEGYEDYRYELRLAANIARSSGQRVTRLAGNNSGADILFVAKSGHHCGVACYRARTVTPALQRINDECRSVSQSLAPLFERSPAPANWGVEVIYPSFPVLPGQVEDAKALLAEMWVTPSRPDFEANGVKVRRLKFLAGSWLPGTLQRVRLRFLIPVPDGEHVRIDRHLVQKVERENSSWAGPSHLNPRSFRSVANFRSQIVAVFRDFSLM